MSTDALRTDPDFKGDHWSVKMTAGIGDGIQILDADMTSGSPILHSASAQFSSSRCRPGMIAAVVGAGAAGATLFTTIASFTDSSHIVLTNNASTSVTGGQAIWGTDNYAAFSAALAASPPTGNPLEIDIPFGMYCVSAGLSVPSGACLSGRGRRVSVIAYLAASGNCITINGSVQSNVANLGVICLEGPNTAKGIYAYHVKQLHLDVRVQGFDTCIHVSGNDTTSYSEDVWLKHPDVRMFRSVGISVDHTVGFHILHGVARTADNNPLSAWGMIYDTGCSGIYLDKVDLEFCGTKIQNTMPTTEDVGRPPEWFYWDKVAADSCPTHGIHLDASLGVPDGIGRVGKSLHLYNCWAAFSTVDGKDGILVEGGQDVILTNPRVRVNRRHGIHITGGEQVRIVNPYVAGNNFQNLSNGSGIYVEGSATGYVDILGGICGDNISGDGSGHQYYGIYLKSDYDAPFSIVGTVFAGNQTGAIGNFAVSSHQRIVGYEDPSSAATKNRLYMTKGRLEVGDGAFYLDYMNDFANAVGVTFDNSLFLRVIRDTAILKAVVGTNGSTLTISSTLTNIVCGSTTITVNSVGAVSVTLGQPVEFAGWTPSQLNTTPSAPRIVQAINSSTQFVVNNDSGQTGTFTTGGATVTIRPGRFDFESDIHCQRLRTRDISGLNADPMIGWDVNVPALRVVAGARLVFFAGNGQLPLKVSNLGDVLEGKIDIGDGGSTSNDVTASNATADKFAVFSGSGGSFKGLKNASFTPAKTYGLSDGDLLKYHAATDEIVTASQADVIAYISGSLQQSDIAGLETRLGNIESALTGKAASGVQTGTTSGHTHTQI